MEILTRSIILSISFWLTTFSAAAQTLNDDIIYFDAGDSLPSDTVGRLEGRVKFAQNTIIPSVNKVEEDIHQHLVGLRETMVMFRPISPINYDSSLWMIVRNANGRLVHLTRMENPDNLPKPFIPEAILESETFDYEIASPEEMAKLYEPPESDDIYQTPEKSTYLAQLFEQYDAIKITITDENRIDAFTLPFQRVTVPFDSRFENKKLIIEHLADEPTQIYSYRKEAGYTSDKSSPIRVAVNQRNFWIIGDENLKKLRYGEYWSATIAAKYIQPGFSLLFLGDGKISSLEDIKVGSANQVVVNNIAIGLLTPPRETYNFTQNPDYQRQYFQQLPAARLIVSEYEPAYLKEVMMPWGVLYTPENADPSQGGGHKGDMRHKIAKQLIGNGINLANLGVHSSMWKLKFTKVNQHTMHTAIGVYYNEETNENETHIHGWSGGGGLATLHNTIGNEVSHELGHSYRLGHFLGGKARFTHQSTSTANSTWGWDSDWGYFIPNFDLKRPRQEICFRDQGCTAPYLGEWAFNKDAMSGGAPMWSSFNAFTLHTPYSLSKIQWKYETNFANFDRYSPTGYSMWDSENQIAVPEEVEIPKSMTLYKADGQQVADANTMVDLLNRYDGVRYEVSDENWTESVQMPDVDARHEHKTISVVNNSSKDVYAHRSYSPNNPMLVAPGETKIYKFNGKNWTSPTGLIPALFESRAPEIIGVPVTTILGYYDTDLIHDSYIYPPLYGSYGNVFPMQNEEIDSAPEKGCYAAITVATEQIRKYRLHNFPLFLKQNGEHEGRHYYNKFQINVPTEDAAHKAEIYCEGALLAERDLEPRNTSIELKVHIWGVTEEEQQQALSADNTVLGFNR